MRQTADEREIFSFPRKYGQYLLLPPINYPAVVRYDTVTGEIKYFTENKEVFVKEVNGQKISYYSLVYKNSLYIASPLDNMVYKLDIESGESTVIELPIRSRCGAYALAEYKEEIWITPYDGQVIVRWNPLSNEAREYERFSRRFLCINPADGSECKKRIIFRRLFMERMYIFFRAGRICLCKWI